MCPDFPWPKTYNNSQSIFSLNKYTEFPKKNLSLHLGKRFNIELYIQTTVQNDYQKENSGSKQVYVRQADSSVSQQQQILSYIAKEADKACLGYTQTGAIMHT